MEKRALSRRESRRAANSADPPSADAQERTARASPPPIAECVIRLTAKRPAPSRIPHKSFEGKVFQNQMGEEHSAREDQRGKQTDPSAF